MVEPGSGLSVIINMKFPASITLGTILRRVPDCYRSPHKIVEIMQAYRLGYADTLWLKRDAVITHLRASMELHESRGCGNRAFRRHMSILYRQIHS